MHGGQQCVDAGRLQQAGFLWERGERRRSGDVAASCERTVTPSPRRLPKKIWASPRDDSSLILAPTSKASRKTR